MTMKFVKVRKLVSVKLVRNKNQRFDYSLRVYTYIPIFNITTRSNLRYTHESCTRISVRRSPRAQLVRLQFIRVVATRIVRNLTRVNFDVRKRAVLAICRPSYKFTLARRPRVLHTTAVNRYNPFAERLFRNVFICSGDLFARKLFVTITTRIIKIRRLVQ